MSRTEFEDTSVKRVRVSNREVRTTPSLVFKITFYRCLHYALLTSTFIFRDGVIISVHRPTTSAARFDNYAGLTDSRLLRAVLRVVRYDKAVSTARSHPGIILL